MLCLIFEASDNVNRRYLKQSAWNKEEAKTSELYIELRKDIAKGDRIRHGNGKKDGEKRGARLGLFLHHLNW